MSPGQPARNKSRPNILLIMVDDMGFFRPGLLWGRDPHPQSGPACLERASLLAVLQQCHLRTHSGVPADGALFPASQQGGPEGLRYHCRGAQEPPATAPS